MEGVPYQPMGADTMGSDKKFLTFPNQTSKNFNIFA